MKKLEDCSLGEAFVLCVVLAVLITHILFYIVRWWRI